MKKKIKKVKHRLPIELALTLRSKGSVINSKKEYNRKREKGVVRNEIRQNF